MKKSKISEHDKRAQGLFHQRTDDRRGLDGKIKEVDSFLREEAKFRTQWCDGIFFEISGVHSPPLPIILGEKKSFHPLVDIESVCFPMGKKENRRNKGIMK
ncbi:hypothetical protein AVEN_129703-1 [Araneus ventricosus]|uniref:Uncharacterized protein n=1 Tax=Araneus ventricosus TaxID=182803 RepID=A0A4Y2DKJ6_ARAVE|nr:hypothetical protein AVEN_129703-1 [Araneus ventricosus]